jgi:hypothetical protein
MHYRKERFMCVPRKGLVMAGAACLLVQASLAYAQFWHEVAPAATWAPRCGHASVVFQGMIWVMGGHDEPSDVYFNDVWYSSDGDDWVQATASAPWATRQLMGAVVFQGKMWVMGGVRNSNCFNDVWCSGDGANWEQKPSAPWSARYGHCPLVFDGRIWVLGGAEALGGSYVNDAWYTVDGESWVKARVDSAPEGFMKAASKRGVVFMDRMWLTGGYTEQGAYTDDVYWSTDGVQWVLATDAPGWLSRGHHGLLAFRGHLWLFGGYRGDGSVLLNDVWRSADGAVWYQLDNAQWSSRALHACLVYNSAIWVLGGHLGYYGVVSDTWRLLTAGDLNCDGLVDFGDINPFILRLTNPTQYALQYPCYDE